MEVVEHRVIFPPAEDVYDVAVNTAKEHRHGSLGAERAREDLLRAEANSSSDALDAGADGVGDVLTFEDAPLCAVVLACNRYLYEGAATL